MGTVNWQDAAFKTKLYQIAYRNMSRAAQYAVGQVKRSMRKGGQKRVKSTEGRVLGKLPTVHSTPGQVPFVQTGRLRGSITSRVRREGPTLVGSYGSDVKYARRLELGFFGRDSRGIGISQGPRPYLRPVLQKYWEQIKRILLTGNPS